MSLSLLKNVSLFSNLNEEDIKEIFELTDKERFKNGKVILLEFAESGDTFYIISKGKVKVTRMNEEGKEVVLSILGKGDFFGEMSIIDGLAKSASVFAIEDTEAVTINGKNFLELLKKNPKISFNLLKVLCSRIRKSDAHIKRLSMMNTIGKVASTLLTLAETSKKKGKISVEIEKLPSLKDIANMAGINQSSVSNVLNSLVKSGYIKKSGNKIIIKNYSEFESIFC